jgi:hypothetical protein
MKILYTKNTGIRHEFQETVYRIDFPEKYAAWQERRVREREEA